MALSLLLSIFQFSKSLNFFICWVCWLSQYLRFLKIVIYKPFVREDFVCVHMVMRSWSPPSLSSSFFFFLFTPSTSCIHHVGSEPGSIIPAHKSHPGDGRGRTWSYIFGLHLIWRASSNPSLHLGSPLLAPCPDLVSCWCIIPGAPQDLNTWLVWLWFQ